MDGLTEGRIVHYVLSDWDPVKPHCVGEHRPAIVVKLWEKGGGATGCAQLQVFMDGTNDFKALPVDVQGNSRPHPDCTAATMWKTTCLFSEEPKPGTWHWIERA